MDESLANAVKYAGMLSSQDVNGDSAMATANAGMVLTAETAINDAVTAADTAIMEANAAKLAAEDIENEAEKDAVMRLLDEAIETAMDLKTDAQTYHRQRHRRRRESAGLRSARPLPLVEGSDNADMPKTAADAGEAVAILGRGGARSRQTSCLLLIANTPAMGAVH